MKPVAEIVGKLGLRGGPIDERELSARQVRRVFVAFGAVFTLLLSLLAFSVAAFQELAGAINLNIHTYEVLGTTQRLEIAAVKMQTGFRGFVLTGEEDFLTPYVLGNREFTARLQQLRRLTEDNAEHQARIEQIGRIADQWRTVHIEPGIEVRRQFGSDDVDVATLIGVVNPNRGQTFLESLDAVLAQIRTIEDGLLAQRRERSESLESLTRWLLLLGGVFGLVVAVGVGVVASRQSRSLLVANRRLREEAGDRERAEAALAHLSRSNELILKSAGEGILGVDAAGHFTFLNPAGARMLGWAPEDLRGMPRHETLHGAHGNGVPYPVEECPIHASLSDGQVRVVDDDVFWRRDGSSFQVEYIATPILEDGEITGSVVTFRDITQRREIEKLKDEFVSVVSHELRTPLTSIRGSLGLLASGVIGTLPERGQRMLEIAAQNTDRLVRLINDILDIERIESGTVRMERTGVEVRKLVEIAVDTVRSTAEKAEVEIELLAETGAVWGDPDRIVQVLTNLLSNAIKFSPTGSLVTVATSAENGRIVFRVTDRGRGIPTEKQEVIFGRFQQVDASDSREKGGTGLGLAIVRSIVQQHGGSVSVESEPGRGSTFHFDLPAYEPVLKNAPVRSASHILVCDDDGVAREVVAERLRCQGYSVRTVPGGMEAIESARTDRPSAILLDMIMPGMDGCETMAHLKDDPATATIPIVIYSNLRSPGEGADTNRAAGWVVKDSDDESLFRTLASSLSESRKIGRILLVEDDPDFAEVLIAIFERRGLVVTHVRNCEEAMHECQVLIPDLLVLDVMLGELDGFDVVACLRGDERLRAVPLVVYSALDLDDEQRQRLKLGPTEFMTKGRIAPEEFEERVIALLDELVKRTDTAE